MKVLNNKYLLLGVGLALLAGGIACKKKKEFSGPDLSIAKDGFELTSTFDVSDTVVNLGINETIGFSAAFNQKVSWEVVLTGLESKAEMTYNGTGEYFVAEDVQFDGRSGTNRFFINDEYVNASLTVLGLDSVFSIDSIETIQSYSYHGKVINGVKHIVVDNFEQAGGLKYGPVSLAVADDALDSRLEFLADTNFSVEGSRSFKMAGNDDNNNGWMGGINSENLVDFYLVQDTSRLLIDSGIDPANLFFNIYIYGAGYESTAVQLKVYEYDHKTFIQGDTVVPLLTREDMRFDIFQAGVGGPPTAKTAYDQGVNDGWIFNVEVSWTGWKRVSIPYTSFWAANEFTAGAGGDRKKESWRICGMAVSLLAFPATGIYSEVYVDELVITQGGRFQK
jgi:hypothetical protein